MDITSIYKDELKKKRDRITQIIEQITPLKEEVNALDKEIEALMILIGPDEKVEPQSVTKGKLSGMTGMDAYKELAKNLYQDKPFRESQIRNIANLKGLLIRGKPIGRNTSWAIIKTLYTDGFLERIGKGLYRYKEPPKLIRRIRVDEENEKNSSDKNKTGLSFDFE